MKKILFVSMLALSFAAVADHHDMDDKPIEEVKKMIAEGTDQRIAALQAHKACVQAAADRDAIKKCREEMKSKRKDLKDGMHSKKEAFRAKMKAEKENKKK